MSILLYQESSSIITGITYDGLKTNGTVDWGGLCNAKLLLSNFGTSLQVS